MGSLHIIFFDSHILADGLKAIDEEPKGHSLALYLICNVTCWTDGLMNVILHTTTGNQDIA